MFYYASKIVFFFIQPSTLAVLALGTGLFLLGRSGNAVRFGRLGRRLVCGGLAWIVGAGFLPVGDLMMLPLEERFSEGQPAAVDRSARGIIILGGFEDGWVTAGRGGLALNEAAERLTEGLRLARQLPEARVVFTGGVGQLMASADAADAVDTYLTQAGIAPTRIVIENKSRTTFENAVLTRAFIDPKPGERWLLVTSAFHMPRAVGAFRSAGFDILPFPVDFRTRDWGDVFVPYSSMPDGLKRADVAAKEWAGLFAYWLTGRSSSIFPGP